MAAIMASKARQWRIKRTTANSIKTRQHQQAATRRQHLGIIRRTSDAMYDRHQA